VGGAEEVIWETIASRAFGIDALMLGVVTFGAAGEMKSTMRARDGVDGVATCEWLAAGLCERSPAIRRATRSAINRAGSSSLLTLKIPFGSFRRLTFRRSWHK